MPPIDWVELGFPAGIAILLAFIIWKLGERIINAFKDMYDSHKTDIKDMQTLHRNERNECYEKHERMFDQFDKTLQSLSSNLNNKS